MEYSRRKASKASGTMGVFKRGLCPLFLKKQFPLSKSGEGDTGGEVDKDSSPLHLTPFYAIFKLYN